VSRQLQWLLALCALITGAFLAYSLKGTDDQIRIAGNATLTIIPFVAFLCCARASRRIGGRVGTAWLLFGLGALAWGLGQMVWAYYETIRNVEVPFPSLADAGYLTMVPLSALGAVLYSTHSGRKATQTRALLDGLIIMLSLFFVSWLALLRPLIHDASGSLLGQLLSLAYPLGDIVIVTLVVFTLSRDRSQSRQPLVLMGIGLLAFSAADSFFLYDTLLGTYTTGSFVDTGWVCGFLLLAIGGWVAPSHSVSVIDDPTPTRLSVMLPYIPLSVAVVAGVVEIWTADTLDQVAWLVALALFSVIVLRQLTMLFEGMGWVHELEERVEERTTEVRAAAAELERREAYFRSLVQHGSDLVLVLERDGAVSYASPSTWRILGKPPVELIGGYLANLLTEADRTKVPHLLRAAQARPGTTLTVEWNMAHADGTWRSFETMVTGALTDTDMSLVLNSRDITERKQLEEQLRHEAFHDPLTGLANRALLRDRLEQALAIRERDGQEVAVLLLDLDDFRVVNDTQGHAAGDIMLQEVAGRLASVARPGDTVARLGGDEFALLMSDRGVQPKAESVARQIQAQFEVPFEVMGSLVSGRATTGICVVNSSDVGAEDVLRQADVAMYVAKAEAKGSHRVFDPVMHTVVMERMELQADLGRGIAAEEFIVHYQPVVDLQSGRISGVEALVRWQHPTLGLLPPNDFITLAEENGTVVPLGAYVLRTACRQLVRWDAVSGRRIDLSVNASPIQLEDPAFVDTVAAILAETNLDPDRLILEITESALAQNIESVVAGLTRLRTLGVRLAIDDFGTGYSSLSYLAKMPVQVLKIDRSFIVEMEISGAANSLVTSILELANRRNLICVAEGIELTRVADELTSMGCPKGQGYWFSRPVPAPELLALLEAEPQTESELHSMANSVRRGSSS
jgi:diguanylate cyclase (GGDEF)-like protein/PAS domain S-box-containing protein